jgi:hypothetical protein
VKKGVQIGQGKALDLVTTKGDEGIAIEIETGKSNVDANVRKCREAEFGELVVVYIKGLNSKT